MSQILIKVCPSTIILYVCTLNYFCNQYKFSNAYFLPDEWIKILIL